MILCSKKMKFRINVRINLIKTKQFSSFENEIMTLGVMLVP